MFNTFLKKKQHENSKCKTEHYKHVGCFKAQVCAAKPNGVTTNPWQIQLACILQCISEKTLDRSRTGRSQTLRLHR